MSNPSRQRGFIWWITALLAPLGVLGGVVGLMSLSAGVIWKGPFAYLVIFWSEQVRVPFADVLNFLASLSNQFLPIRHNCFEYS